MAYILNIGDKSDNGQITIIDEDRLCYLVQSNSKGATGIRTISKALLKEYIDYFNNYPNASSNDARDALCGQSEIDKFEYGYSSTLRMMAKMALNQTGSDTYSIPNEEKEEAKLPLQQIYYGAPGTGKSHTIKDKTDGQPKENVFRTTFHPDSDYSTFVGCYKPTMKTRKSEVILSVTDLTTKLKEIKASGVSYPCHKFAAKYWESLKDLDTTSIKSILTACGFTDSMNVEISKGIAIGQEISSTSCDDKIIYSFVPQTFTKAYIRAWQTEEPVYLVIEEINRGNCAQIFGDLFQLLDRGDDGCSEYPIKADNDLAMYLAEQLSSSERTDIPEMVKNGDELVLPSNLYIWATMNTSDQSLFPIDSAFKRRWDWEYEPIKYKNTDWVIEIGREKYSWTAFQKEVNNRIFDATNSEDKMLGDYFVNPHDGIISEKLLLNKVLFYLWNDVCKDGDGDIFKTDEDKDVKFSDLYGEGGTGMLLSMMRHLNVKPIEETEEIGETEDKISE